MDGARLAFHVLGGGGGGFFLACESLGDYATIPSPPAPPSPPFFLKWRLARAHYFQSLGQDQSTVAQRTSTALRGFDLLLSSEASTGEAI